MTNLSLNQYLLEHLAAHPDKKDLILIMNDLATIGKVISHAVNKAGVADVRGATGSKNVQEESVQKLDEISNELCKNYLRQTGHFAAMASEEEDTSVPLNPEAKYIIAFDPLDGSSNIDVNVSIGTIFSIHPLRRGIPYDSDEQFLQPGHQQVLAGYILYGSSTVLVFSFGSGVAEFTLDNDIGEFLLSNHKVSTPDNCTYISYNAGNMAMMQNQDQAFIRLLAEEKGIGLRYIGSLVADFHRTLLMGGLFLYPALDKDGSGKFAGKLRLNYEIKPLAFLIEQTGGRALCGLEPALEMMPKKLHQRVAFSFGNKTIVDEYRVSCQNKHK